MGSFEFIDNNGNALGDEACKIKVADALRKKCFLEKVREKMRLAGADNATSIGATKTDPVPKKRTKQPPNRLPSTLKENQEEPGEGDPQEETEGAMAQQEEPEEEEQKQQHQRQAKTSSEAEEDPRSNVSPPSDPTASSDEEKKQGERKRPAVDPPGELLDDANAKPQPN